MDSFKESRIAGRISLWSLVREDINSHDACGVAFCALVFTYSTFLLDFTCNPLIFYAYDVHLDIICFPLSLFGSLDRIKSGIL